MQARFAVGTLVVALLLLCSVVSFAAKPPKPVPLSGIITDLECAKKSASDATAPTHADCARKCSGNGSAMALVSDSDKHVYAIENTFLVKGMEGTWVNTTYVPGTKPETIKLVSVIPK